MRLFKFVLAALLVALLGMGTSPLGTVSAQTVSFKDVHASFWGYEAIQWGVEQNIIAGYGDDTFRPHQKVTEEEFIALLVRAFNIATYSEENERWSEPYYRVAHQHNLLPLSFHNSEAITRQQVAEIIVGARGVHFNGDDAVEYMLNKGLTNGKTSPTIEGYRGEDTLTRAEAITFIKNVKEKTGDSAMRVKPYRSTPRFLLSTSEEFQITKPQVLLTLEQVIQKFNEGLKEVGLNSIYHSRFEALIFNEDQWFHNSSWQNYHYAHFSTEESEYEYSLVITLEATTGELNSVRVMIPDNRKLKEVVQAAITAIMGDSAASKQFYEEHKLAKLMEESAQSKYSTVKTVANEHYEATYQRNKWREVTATGEEKEEVISHAFTVKKL